MNLAADNATQYRTSSSVALGLSHIGTRTQRSGQHDQGHSFCKSFLHGLILHQGLSFIWSSMAQPFINIFSDK